MIVDFHDCIPDEQLEYAVIAARYNEQWLFCRHRNRETYEIPGGHREPGESITETATRELYEETGALDYDICPICCYSVTKPTIQGAYSTPTFGKIFFADIYKLGPLPPSEIAETILIDHPFAPFLRWTYPDIQPLLLKKVIEYMTL